MLEIEDTEVETLGNLVICCNEISEVGGISKLNVYLPR